MAYQAEPFGEALRQARARKGWSQRDLSQRAGVPQAHISKIESGAVDMRLSTLVQLARLLDLEPVLTPRAALPAVQAIVREAETDDPARALRAAARGLSLTAERIRRARPADTSAERLATLAPGIAALAGSPLASSAVSALLHSVREVQDAADDGRNLARVINRLADLRESMAHNRSPEARPAYTLDDED